MAQCRVADSFSPNPRGAPTTGAVSDIGTFSSAAGMPTLSAVEGEWISQAEAARRLGCTVGAVLSLAERGVVLMTDPPAAGARRPRTSPSVNAESLGRAGQVLEQDQAEVAARRADKGTGPPPDGQVWLSIAETSALIGVSRSRVGQWVRTGKLPATRRRRLWWVRRHDAEVIANARRFRQRYGRDPVDLGRATRPTEGTTGPGSLAGTKTFWFIEAKSTASDTRVGMADDADVVGEKLLAWLREGWEPAAPIKLRVATRGRHLGDLLPTDGAYIVVASDRFVGTLRTIGASGWKAFPTQLTYADGDALAGYQLLVPTGRCADFREQQKALGEGTEYPIDPSNGWDGSDVFWREGPLFWRFLTTDRVRQALMKAQLERVAFQRPYT